MKTIIREAIRRLRLAGREHPIPDIKVREFMTETGDKFLLVKQESDRKSRGTRTLLRKLGL